MTSSIFVSSTFFDLEAHRRHVRDAIIRLELTFKAMEFFGALPGTPKEECLRLVRTSNIFVGIIGMRYGVIDDIDGKSLTQLEYEEAQAVRLPTLMYLIDEERHPVLPKHVEIGVGAEMLVKFKERLKNAHVVSTFTSPEDLAAKVTQDVVRLVNTMAKVPEAQVMSQLAATPMHFHHLTIPGFEFLKTKIAAVCMQNVPDSVLRESLGFLLSGDGLAASCVLARDNLMSMDEAIDGLMKVEKVLAELVASLMNPDAS